MSSIEAAHARRHMRLTWSLAVASMVIGYGLTYVFPTEDWPLWRRIGAGMGMRLWCTYLVVLTRAGGAFK